MNTFADLLNCKNIKILGQWTDPDGKYPPMPLFELTDPSPEEWKRKARELRVRHAREGAEPNK